MKMTHPDIEAVGDVVDEAVFNAVWAPRGWQLLSEADAYASDQLGMVLRTDQDLEPDQYRTLIAMRGGTYPDAGAKLADLRDAYVATFAGGPPVGPQGAVAVALYDPGEYNVEQVKEHLAAATPEEVDRVKAVEAEGQGRKGIVNYEPAGAGENPATTEKE